MGRGDPTRGSRYNNPVRYLDGDPPRAIVIAYSADGDVDILPRLRPRQDKQLVAHAVCRYLTLVDAEPSVFEQVYDAWDQLDALASYLSEQQCGEANKATAKLRAWCRAERRPLRGPRVLTPDPGMDDTYWSSARHDAGGNTLSL
ncbi:hypothetical protein [Micromonospora sp. NPDC048947]|uniref:hypothetical protein n=1 Tax=Micromonospora sp. NPDC048947 TaxID=3154826 RepID=UPI0033D1CFA1